jgi:hypothetical protein
MNKVPYTLSESSLTIFWEGKPYTLRKDHVNFNLAKKAILDARYDDLGDLIDVVKAVENFVEGDIEVKDEVVYYKGHRLHGVVVDKLLEMLRAGMKDSAPLTNFITRLQANPSANSVNELYSFLSYKSLATTPEGMVLGYKGVQSSFWSTTGNADTIVVQGKTNDLHQILNEVGSTIEVARRCVDDNKDNHCSFGLHIGSYDYANNWAGESGRLLLVEFDPQDAVSVPTDSDFQKLRVSKYKVVSDITDTRKELDTPVYDANKPIYGSDDDVDYDDLDEDVDNFLDLDYDVDEYGDAKVILPDNYDDDDFGADDAEDDCDMDNTGDDDDENLISEDDLVLISVKNYLNKKASKDVYPSVKNVADLRICKSNNVGYNGVVRMLEKLNFHIDPSYANSTLPLGSRLIMPKNF